MIDRTLFDPGPVLPEPPKLSADQRRTLRRQQQLDQGLHPTTRLPLRRPVGEHTCGDCTHRKENPGHARTYWKCDQVVMTAGPATDVRLSWPACIKWEGRP